MDLFKVNRIGNTCTSNYFKKKVVTLLITCVLLVGMLTLNTMMMTTVDDVRTTRDNQMTTSGNVETAYRNRSHDNTYLVLWDKIDTYLEKRPYAASADFSVCQYNNCRLTLDRNDARISDAIMFEGRHLALNIPFRPTGQIWIFNEHEAPPRVERETNKTDKYGGYKWRGVFNWTMTYDKVLADIHFPYGELRRHNTYISKDYDKIAANKTKGALIVTSDCNPPSKRMEFINALKRYTDVEVLGKCGKKWNCGAKCHHDDCFDILNSTYSFYLAFENALCQQYYTEKLFENFKYDILLITRGGRRHESSLFFPKGSVISADEFEDPQELGEFLNMLRSNKREYAKRLAVKSQYYSINYRESYQRALCDLCLRLNHQDIYHKTIPDVFKVVSSERNCESVK